VRQAAAHLSSSVAQGRTTADTLALALGELAASAGAAECRQGAVGVTLHASVPPAGATSRRCQYMYVCARLLLGLARVMPHCCARS
jgi:hypothetical protein